MRERMEPGFYRVRIAPGADWQVARYEGSEFWLAGVEESFREIEEVGPRIEEPE